MLLTNKKSPPQHGTMAYPIIGCNDINQPAAFEVIGKVTRLSVVGGKPKLPPISADLRLLEEVLSWLQRQVVPPPWLCIRWRSVFLCDPNSVVTARKLIAQYPEAAKRLRVAVDEETAVAQRDALVPVLRQFYEDGIVLILDDLGGGLCSMALYRENLFSAVRLPPRWSTNIGCHPADDMIARHLLSLAQSLGMNTIAEGVNNQEVLEALLEMGVDYVQGMAVARPIALDKFPTAAPAKELIQDLQTQRTLSYAPQHRLENPFHLFG